jgi:hypothetical protein
VNYSVVWLVSQFVLVSFDIYYLFSIVVVFLLLFLGWGEIESVSYIGRKWSGVLYQLRITNERKETFCGIRIGRGNRSARRYPVPMSLCSSHIPHELTPGPPSRGTARSTVAAAHCVRK